MFQDPSKILQHLEGKLPQPQSPLVLAPQPCPSMRPVSRPALRTASRQFSAAASSASLTSPAEAAPTLNPRWLTNLQSRISACLETNPPADHGARLKKYRDYLTSNWLELSAGREGFLTDERWRGLDKFGVAWGDMHGEWAWGPAAMVHVLVATCGLIPSRQGHVNNVMYNRYAESGRVNWFTSLAAHAPPDQRQAWIDLISPRGTGLILKSIKTDYKLPVAYPDRITVIHKLARQPSYASENIFLDAVIYSEAHGRVAARCYEDIAVYNYRAGKRATLVNFMVDELQRVYQLQEKNRQETENKVKELHQGIQAIEDRLF
ncbi:uncharacterized protein UV8b_00593 [Ustilaginoidea virens]|uniref:Thioesterase/thiol ester dehydrase-isomerase n=1 Tax=Ustilaginoidea virens TaxID=1159556 RepID=A0A8E5ME85_USTVR|nr:uncharacterized protein UV8b_00593 [Ustilaginoidea virens]QUC16352.1 hypothetical protein UV8b_00593 [Ustilaginoidea virens]